MDVVPGIWVFEGVNGVGKSTLISAVGAELEKMKVSHSVFKFPSAGPVGQFLRDALEKKVRVERDAMLHLFVADFLEGALRLQGMLDEDEDRVVLVDRWPPISCYSYTHQWPHWRTIDILQAFDGAAAKVPRPRMTFVLRADAETINERLAARDRAANIYTEGRRGGQTSELTLRLYQHVSDGVFRGAGGSSVGLPISLDATRPVETLASIAIGFAAADGDGE